jgi:hypothetical protein
MICTGAFNAAAQARGLDMSTDTQAQHKAQPAL